jgi:hypothetical protein
MVKGAAAGNLLADAIKQAIQWAREWTIDTAKATLTWSGLRTRCLRSARRTGSTLGRGDDSYDVIS